MKKRILPLLGLLLAVLSLGAQTVDRSVWASGSSGYSIQLSHTFGQIWIQSATSATEDLTQGFQQPDHLYITNLPSFESSFLSLSPNPTTQTTRLEVRNEVSTEINILIYDLKGAVVAQPYLVYQLAPQQKGEFLLSRGQLSDGLYLVRIEDRLSRQVLWLKWQLLR
ncbi:MAG: T9SS type A sorting domain-containing protein [Bacteroidota bacterium]